MPVTHQFRHDSIRLLEEVLDDPFDLSTLGKLREASYSFVRMPAIHGVKILIGL